MGREYSSGLTAKKYTEASIERIRNMDMERYAGQMERSMLGSGQMGSSMGLGNILILREKSCKASGIWARGLSDLVLFSFP